MSLMKINLIYGLSSAAFLLSSIFSDYTILSIFLFVNIILFSFIVYFSLKKQLKENDTKLYHEVFRYAPIINQFKLVDFILSKSDSTYVRSLKKQYILYCLITFIVFVIFCSLVFFY